MGDMKDKVKGFMKKVNNPFSSSPSGKFKGQGRVLGSSSSETAYPIPSRPSQPLPARSNTAPSPSRPSNTPAPDQRKTDTDISKNPESNRKPITGFDPFDSLITPAKRSQNGYSLNLVECPICNQAFRSEEEVSEHVDICTNNANTIEVGVGELSISDAGEIGELEERVSGFLSANPPEGSLEVVLKLLKNIVRDPENAKFRKIRMSNPKIREAIGEVAGGIDLLEFVGFVLKEEGGEVWAVMEVPGREGIGLINKVVALLDPKKPEEEKRVPNVASIASSKAVDEPAEPKKIDRQIRVFFSVPESVAARIELPDSFYNLSSQELKREAEMRKKKLADSQLLIPKSYKEKQAKASRRRYNRAIMRFQFPDGVVLQGTFAPWELTSSLYEFVSLSLKEPSLEFELLHPVVVRRRVIPHSSAAPGEKPPTLEDEDLVPSSLIKFRPRETDSVVFTGLNNDLLQLIEPLQ